MQGPGGIDVDLRKQRGSDADPARICREDWFPEAATTNGASTGVKNNGGLVLQTPAPVKGFFKYV